MYRMGGSMARRKLEPIVDTSPASINEWKELDPKPNSEARKVIREMKEAAEIIKWRKTTDKRVLFAHMMRAWARNSLTYYAPCRDIALLARVGTMTAARSTKRLIADGFISILEKHVPGSLKPNLYQLHNDRNVILIHILYTCITLTSEYPAPDWSFEVARQDCFRNGFSLMEEERVQRLGNRAGEIFADLLYKPSQSAKELAEIVGCSILTAKRSLRKLEVYDLVKLEDENDKDKTNCKYIANEFYDFEVVEKETGTFGKTSQKLRHYEQERNEYRLRLSDDDYRKQWLKEKAEGRKRRKEYLARRKRYKMDKPKKKAKK